MKHKIKRVEVEDETARQLQLIKQFKKEIKEDVFNLLITWRELDETVHYIKIVLAIMAIVNSILCVAWLLQGFGK